STVYNIRVLQYSTFTVCYSTVYNILLYSTFTISFLVSSEKLTFALIDKRWITRTAFLLNLIHVRFPYKTNKQYVIYIVYLYYISSMEYIQYILYIRITD